MSSENVEIRVDTQELISWAMAHMFMTTLTVWFKNNNQLVVSYQILLLHSIKQKVGKWITGYYKQIST